MTSDDRQKDIKIYIINKGECGSTIIEESAVADTVIVSMIIYLLFREGEHIFSLKSETEPTQWQILRCMSTDSHVCRSSRRRVLDRRISISYLRNIGDRQRLHV